MRVSATLGDERDVTPDEIKHQIQRCRRLASMMTDDDVRHSLEDLADEYEEQLPKRRRPFMLSGNE